MRQSKVESRMILYGAEEEEEEDHQEDEELGSLERNKTYSLANHLFIIFFTLLQKNCRTCLQ